MENNQEQRPLVGMGILIFKDGKVLLGKRKGSHGEGEYSLPGGHLEYLESFAECAKRETKEECGLDINNIRFLSLANVKKYAPKHYINVIVIADYQGGEPELLESDRYDSWGWYDLDNLPEPMFEFSLLAVESYKTGQNYFDF